ncbi:myosin heavy chain, clone 203-like [Watersipora subatra]|uniref:myosin heavy chain, clone 203-like n=1 Tax=Watersipora subatra TaxID=2589382 RepID=UPI00355B0C57
MVSLMENERENFERARQTHLLNDEKSMKVLQRLEQEMKALSENTIASALSINQLVEEAEHLKEEFANQDIELLSAKELFIQTKLNTTVERLTTLDNKTADLQAFYEGLKSSDQQLRMNLTQSMEQIERAANRAIQLATRTATREQSLQTNLNATVRKLLRIKNIVQNLEEATTNSEAADQVIISNLTEVIRSIDAASQVNAELKKQLVETADQLQLSQNNTNKGFLEIAGKFQQLAQVGSKLNGSNQILSSNLTGTMTAVDLVQSRITKFEECCVASVNFNHTLLQLETIAEDMNKMKTIQRWLQTVKREFNANLTEFNNNGPRREPEWKRGSLWIGAKQVNGVWKRTGKSTELADSLFWNTGEPNFSYENCVETSQRFNYYANNWPCQQLQHFVCGKLI